MRMIFEKTIAAMLFLSAIVPTLMVSHRAAAQGTAESSRERIGEVYGKPVFRDEIRPREYVKLQYEVHRLFLEPVKTRYYDAHEAELTPTKAEIDVVTAFFQMSDEERLRLQLKGTETRLRTVRLSKKQRYDLQLDKLLIEQELDASPKDIHGEITSTHDALVEMFAEFLLSFGKWAIEAKPTLPVLTKEDLAELAESADFEEHQKFVEALEEFAANPRQQLAEYDRRFAEYVVVQWKLERHLHDKYGGGRILWQQSGLEAFDATRKWLESEEQKGHFKITDAKLRETFYRRWTESDPIYIFKDESTIR